MTAKSLVDRQAEDEGLWFEAVTAPEAYLQSALRDLHAAVEHDRAALLADRPEVVGMVERLRCFEHPNEEGEEVMQDAADTLESLAAQLAQRDEEIAKLRKHAEAMAKQITNINGSVCQPEVACPVCAVLQAYRRDFPVTP